MEYRYILCETPAPGVGLVRFNRPQALNALNPRLIAESFAALADFDADEEIGCLIVTGNDRAFAAGADIKEMAERNAIEMMTADDITDWGAFEQLRKPVIAAVSGWALGGGCEYAMMCDFIVASETARFGQPEITLGIMPGAGGTQRLPRAIGSRLALEVMLANRHLKAPQALQLGLVNHVFPVETYLAEAIALAGKIAAMPRIAVQLIKDAVRKTGQMSLPDGLDYEKKNFYLSFDTEDKREGMAAFIEKRPPQWRNR
ncbi:MAG: enoyl-CoA hydratase-related protein [Anaerolineaceae bacterium]|nr:enoyl-CoA hydratase-related protein [Anaerolineaceae bacterium]